MSERMEGRHVGGDAGAECTDQQACAPTHPTQYLTELPGLEENGWIYFVIHGRVAGHDVKTQVHKVHVHDSYAPNQA